MKLKIDKCRRRVVIKPGNARRRGKKREIGNTIKKINRIFLLFEAQSILLGLVGISKLQNFVAKRFQLVEKLNDGLHFLWQSTSFTSSCR